MKIVRIRISNFRCIREADIYPSKHNVLLGPNNSGKTAVLEGLNILLNPESAYWSDLIDENDFYLRQYAPIAFESTSDRNSDTITEAENSAHPQTDSEQTDLPEQEQTASLATYPSIRIEAVISDLSKDDQDVFAPSGSLVPWDQKAQSVRETAEEDEDPFADAEPSIRVVFEAWYNPEEDDFEKSWHFLRHADEDREDSPRFTREHKRHIGFLIYRDIRGLTRPITLHEASLFFKLLRSQDVITHGFEDVLTALDSVLMPITQRPDFASVLNSYKAELENFLALGQEDHQSLSFELTDRTRREVKGTSQLYIMDKIALPLQKSGAGTRSLSLLGILTLIMRRRNRGILALEEPETFLFPHAQRRVIDECLSLADQTFVTTHSPYVLERMPVDGIGRIVRSSEGNLAWHPLQTDDIKQLNLYSKRLRQSCAEALLGRGVIVLEGDSDRWWLYGASRMLHKHTVHSCQIEALELLGVSVVSADTFGDIPKLCRFFASAGLKVIALYDHFDEKEFDTLKDLDSSVPTVFLRQKGLESLLACHLPLTLITKVLLDPLYSKSAALDKSNIDSVGEDELRAKLELMLKQNKGSSAFHEYIMSLLCPTAVPPPFVTIIVLVCNLMKNGKDFGLCSVLD